MSKNETEVLPHNINKDLMNYKFEDERQNYKTCRIYKKIFYNINFITKEFLKFKGKIIRQR